ncbi:MAG TPA: efflux RND transporter periplasmic adaptor subunit [Phnomibacter sp.]|nr:efflux RND transporter periplasmic adaptor subunit [Phnomibacter sp.]
MKELIFSIGISLFLFSCNSKPVEEKATAPVEENIVTLSDAQYKNAGIETGKLGQRSIASVLKVNGKIDVPPQNRVSISVPLGGYVKSTKLLPGMHINKGEVLAVMEDPQYVQLQQDYLTARAQYAYTEGEYNRQGELNQSKATSDKVFEQTKAAYQTQQILVKSLEQKLQLIGLNPAKVSAGNISRTINIYSPINGYVAAVNVNIGKFVNPADVLFELVNPTDIHLALTVFEKDINKLYIGQKLLASTNTDPAIKYPCTVLLISKNLSMDRASEVHCHFDKYDKSLLPGMYMNADIEVNTNTANALPEDAIVRFENKQYVFVVKSNNQFEMLEVQTGDSENGYTEIANAEKLADKTFVTKGAYNLLMKLKNTSDE